MRNITGAPDMRGPYQANLPRIGQLPLSGSNHPSLVPGGYRGEVVSSDNYRSTMDQRDPRQFSPSNGAPSLATRIKAIRDQETYSLLMSLPDYSRDDAIISYKKLQKEISKTKSESAADRAKKRNLETTLDRLVEDARLLNEVGYIERRLDEYSDEIVDDFARRYGRGLDADIIDGMRSDYAGTDAYMSRLQANVDSDQKLSDRIKHINERVGVTGIVGMAAVSEHLHERLAHPTDTPPVYRLPSDHADNFIRKHLGGISAGVAGALGMAGAAAFVANENGIFDKSGGGDSGAAPAEPVWPDEDNDNFADHIDPNPLHKDAIYKIYHKPGVEILNEIMWGKYFDYLSSVPLSNPDGKNGIKGTLEYGGIIPASETIMSPSGGYASKLRDLPENNGRVLVLFVDARIGDGAVGGANVKDLILYITATGDQPDMLLTLGHEDEHARRPIILAEYQATNMPWCDVPKSHTNVEHDALYCGAVDPEDYKADSIFWKMKEEKGEKLYPLAKTAG